MWVTPNVETDSPSPHIIFLRPKIYVNKLSYEKFRPRTLLRFLSKPMGGMLKKCPSPEQARHFFKRVEKKLGQSLGICLSASSQQIR